MSTIGLFVPLNLFKFEIHHQIDHLMSVTCGFNKSKVTHSAVWIMGKLQFISWKNQNQLRKPQAMSLLCLSTSVSQNCEMQHCTHSWLFNLLCLELLSDYADVWGLEFHLQAKCQASGLTTIQFQQGFQPPSPRMPWGSSTRQECGTMELLMALVWSFLQQDTFPILLVLESQALQLAVEDTMRISKLHLMGSTTTSTYHLECTKIIWSRERM